MHADFHLLYVFPEPLPLPRARGVQVAHFVRALAESGIKVTLAYVPSGDSHPFEPIGMAVPESVTLLPLSRGLPWLLQHAGIKSHKLFMIRLAHHIKRMLRHGGAPDVVFFRHVKAAAQFAQSFPALPFIYEAHEVFAKTAKASQRGRLKDIECRIVRQAGLIIANSQGSASGIVELYSPQDPVEVLPNGVDFPVSIPEKDWLHLHQKIVYAGSLFGWKGVDDLVEATRYLGDCHIDIIGGTPDQITRLKERMPSSARAILEFSGQLPQHEVQRRLADACIAVLPNRADPDSLFTSPLKLFEYMAAGCAVVATDLPSVREVLPNDGAYWAIPGNPQSLAAAISCVCNTPEKARDLGHRGRQAVRSRTWRARALALLALWAERNSQARERLFSILNATPGDDACDS